MGMYHHGSLTSDGGWFSVTHSDTGRLTLSHLFLKLSSPILPILSSSWQNGCESGSLVWWDGSWHGFRFHPSATYNHPQCVRQWPMEASEDRGLELSAHHETVTVLFFSRSSLSQCESLFPNFDSSSFLIYSAQCHRRSRQRTGCVR